MRYDEYEPCLPCSVANVYIVGLDIRGGLDNEELIMRIVRILDLYRPINTIFNIYMVKGIYVLGTEDLIPVSTSDNKSILIKYNIVKLNN